MNNSFLYPLLMIVAGIGIPVGAALNSKLGIKLESSALATTILFFVGLVISTIYLIKIDGMSVSIFKFNTPWYFYFGGLFIVFYIISITWVAPRFGVGNAVAFVLLGQLIAISLIDHFGIFGALQSSITIRRSFGLIMMGIGVFLVVKRHA
jgi:bacterial/archaeal transporter family-2 protein